MKDKQAPPFLLQLSAEPFGLRVWVEVDILREALAGLPEGANALSFLQPLGKESGQSLALALLSRPEVGGELAAGLLEDYLRVQALAAAKPAGMTH